MELSTFVFPPCFQLCVAGWLGGSTLKCLHKDMLQLFPYKQVMQGDGVNGKERENGRASVVL